MYYLLNIVSLGISGLRLWYAVMYSNYVLRGKLLFKLEKYKPYKRELKSFLINHAFYSVEEFFCYWFDAIAAWTA
jgi:hypothetical protein